jgi:hypothetical protein
MELPTAKSLPMLAIYGMATALLSLATYHGLSVQQCAEERKAIRSEYQARIDNLQAEIKEVYTRRVKDLMQQDSINQAHLRALEKVKRK